MTSQLLGLRRPVALAAIGAGLAYGLLARFVFGHDAAEGLLDGVMTCSFIFVVPFVIGFVAAYVHPGDGLGMRRAVVLAWAAGTLTIFFAMGLAWEGLICAVVWLPVFLLMAALGGLNAWGLRRASGGRRPLVLASFAIAPFVVAPLEAQLPTPNRIRVVENRIEIAADAATVWTQIREVPPIAPEELGPSFAHRIGFPRPIEARLVGEGVGSVRYATFEGGVTFVEMVTEWEEGRALAFTIDARAVPATTFDQHVAVGGPYFDVLEGRYRIEQAGPGRCVLYLSSRHRLSTRFNAYTRIWTALFMRDIQQNILEVIRRRSERTAAA